MTLSVSPDNPITNGLWIKPPPVFWVIMATAAVLRLYLLQLDINVLLGNGLVQDDAYYYYEIARQFLAHGVVSFDGINATNGFHPLWQAVSLPVFYMAEGHTPIYVMLSLACLLDLVCVYLIFLVVLHLSCHLWGALAAAMLWAFHGMIIRTWFNGLETALMQCTLLLFLLFYIQLYRAENQTLHQHALLGVIAALAFLARTDTALIIFVMMLIAYMPELVRTETRWITLQRGCSFSVSCLLLIAPWLLWNQWTFGSVIQISGQVKYGVWLTGGPPPELPFLEQVVWGAWSSLGPIRIVFEKMFAPILFKLSVSGFVYLIIFVGLLLICIFNSKAFANQIKRFWPFIAGVVFLFLYHAAYRHFVRGWYNGPLLIVFAVLLGLMLALGLERFKQQKQKTLVFFSVSLCMLIIYSPLAYVKIPKNIQVDPRVGAALWINQHAKPGERVGSANAGIVGYYTENPVINLDGVVNQYAYQARLTDTMHQYVAESDIRYLADHKGAMNHLCKGNDFYSCEPAKKFRNGSLVMKVNNK